MTYRPVVRRIVALTGTEARLLYRYRVIAAAGILTTIWIAIVRVAPATVRPGLVPWILFIDLAALGFFFVPALIVTERAEGITDALAATPVRPAELLLSRVGVVTALSIGASGGVIIAAGVSAVAPALAGVALTSIVFTLLAVVMLGKSDTLTAYMLRVPMVAVPLILPALVFHTGIWPNRLLNVSPVTVSLTVMSGHGSFPAFAWLTATAVALAITAVKLNRHQRTTNGPIRQTTPAAIPAGYSPIRAFASVALVDRKTLLRDPLLALIIASIPVVGLAARLIGGIGGTWISTRFGIDIEPHRPLVWAFILVVHTPVMIGSIIGLLFLEDRDAGLLPVLATTRPSLRGIGIYRIGVGVAVTLVMLALAMLIAGASHIAGAAGLAAAAVAGASLVPLPAMLMVALAANRVQGVAVVKAITLPFYLPLATWFGGGWLAPPLHLLPSIWPAKAMWAQTAPGAWGYTALTLVVVVAAGLPLVRHFEHHANL